MESTMRSLMAGLLAAACLIAACACSDSPQDPEKSAPEQVANPYPAPPASTCDPADAAGIGKAQHALYDARIAGQRFGPYVPTDDACKPLLDRTCTTDCDCTFATVGCAAVGISRHEPFSGWRIAQESLKDGQCRNHVSGCMPHGPSDDQAVQCVSGVCAIKGKAATPPAKLSSESADKGAPLVHDAVLTCDPGAPDAWAAELYRRLLAGRAAAAQRDDVAVVEAWTDTCEPALQRDCETVCDCKLVLANYRVHAASRDTAGNYWQQTGANAKAKGCSRGFGRTGGPHPPGVCKPQLACTAGKCTATDAVGGVPCT